MRDIKRIEPFLEELGKVWKENPDLRFMQLISNFQSFKRSDLFYMEEADFIKQLKEFYLGE